MPSSMSKSSEFCLRRQSFCLSSTLHVCAQVCWVGTSIRPSKQIITGGWLSTSFFGVLIEQQISSKMRMEKNRWIYWSHQPDPIMMISWSYHDHIILDHHLDISWPCQDLLNEASSDSDLAGLYQGQLFSRGFHGDTTRFDEVIVILERWIWPTGRFDHNGDAEKTQRCFDLKREMFIKPTNINKHQQTWICKTKTQDISGWLKLIPPQHVPRSYASTPGLLANAKLHNFTFLQHHRLALQLAHAELGALSRELLKRDLTHTERSCSPHPALANLKGKHISAQKKIEESQLHFPWVPESDGKICRIRPDLVINIVQMLPWTSLN